MVARRLRQKNFQGTTVTLKLRYSDFVTLTRSETIAEPTASEHSIYDLAKKLISHFDLRMAKIRLLGVSVSNLVGDKSSFQTFLPFSEYYDKKREVYWVIDKIKDRFGEDSIRWATSLFFW
jgi:DNA polymerase-4